MKELSEEGMGACDVDGATDKLIPHEAKKELIVKNFEEYRKNFEMDVTSEKAQKKRLLMKSPDKLINEYVLNCYVSFEFVATFTPPPIQSLHGSY
jgi:hypothetical protein